MKRCVVVLSGGQDSTTCAFWAREQGYEVHALTVSYGQRHDREVACAQGIAEFLGYQHRIVDIGDALQGTSPLVNRHEEPEQYPDHASLPGGLEKTFVPMRNQLFLTIAANYAYTLGARTLVTGVCEEDYGGYPDCRANFLTAFEGACNTGTFTGEPGTVDSLRVLAPLMNLTKADTVMLAMELPHCYAALAYTHTAYDGRQRPDGKDHASLLRAKGFEQAGVPDPLVTKHVLATVDRQNPLHLPSTPNYSAGAYSKVKHLCPLSYRMYRELVA